MARVSVLPAQRKGKERERERGGGGGFRPGAAGSVRKDMSSMDEAVATRLGLGQLGKQLSMDQLVVHRITEETHTESALLWSTMPQPSVRTRKRSINSSSRLH